MCHTLPFLGLLSSSVLFSIKLCKIHDTTWYLLWQNKDKLCFCHGNDINQLVLSPEICLPDRCVADGRVHQVNTQKWWSLLGTCRTVHHSPETYRIHTHIPPWRYQLYTHPPTTFTLFFKSKTHIVMQLTIKIYQGELSCLYYSLILPTWTWKPRHCSCHQCTEKWI